MLPQRVLGAIREETGGDEDVAYLRHLQRGRVVLVEVCQEHPGLEGRVIRPELLALQALLHAFPLVRGVRLEAHIFGFGPQHGRGGRG